MTFKECLLRWLSGSSNGGTSDCEQQLGQLQESYDALTEDLGLANVKNTKLTGLLETAQKERDDLLELSRLLTQGPDIPDQSKVRWLQASYVQQTIFEQLPVSQQLALDKWFWSDADYLVCPKSSIDFFLDYFKMFWLPNLKYTVFEWTKLDGTKVEIWADDCDDIQDFFQGIPSLNSKWSCFPWGTFWAEIEGLFMSGGHAFGFIICCDDNYKEESPSTTPTKGLTLYIIEPQMSQMWKVNTPAGELSKYALKDLKLTPAAAFTVKGLWLVKV